MFANYSGKVTKNMLLLCVWSLFWMKTIEAAPYFSANDTMLRKVDLVNLSIVMSPSITKNLLFSSSNKHAKLSKWVPAFRPILESSSNNLN